MNKFYRYGNEIVSLNNVSNVRISENVTTTTRGGYKHDVCSYYILIYYRGETTHNSLCTYDKAEALRIMNEIFTILTTK